MSAANYDFTIEQGVSFKLSLIYKDSEYNIIDLTNWCARLTMHTNYKNITRIFETTNTDPTQYSFYIDGPNGKVVLLIPASTTNDFDFNEIKYDLELQSPDDFYASGGKYTVRLMNGVITVKKRSSEYPTVLDCQP